MNLFQKISLRLRLTLFTMASLVCFIAVSLFLFNQNTKVSIISAQKPLTVVATKFAIEELSQDLASTDSPEIQTVIINTKSQEKGEMEIRKVEEEISFVLNDTARDIRQYSYWLFLFLIIVSGVWVYAWSGKILEPVEQLAEEMKNRTAKNLNEPLKNHGVAKEIQKLSDSFNIMICNLNQSFSIQKRFNANAAHELRTPVTVLQTNLEALAEEPEITLEDYQEFYQITKRTVHRMGLLIENLFQMTQMETVERTEQIDLSCLVEQVYQESIPLADQCGIRIEKSLENASFILMGKESLFYTAVYNLVENAIKYNKEGGAVKIYLSKEQEKEAKIMISDTGIGIEEKEIVSIFQPFYRVDASRNRSLGGAGMGLCLVKNIVEFHDGTIEAVSQIGKGSCFTIKIPLVN